MVNRNCKRTTVTGGCICGYVACVCDRPANGFRQEDELQSGGVVNAAECGVVVMTVMIMIMMDDRGEMKEGPGIVGSDRLYVSRLLRSSLLRGRLEGKERTGVLLRVRRQRGYRGAARVPEVQHTGTAKLQLPVAPYLTTSPVGISVVPT